MRADLAQFYQINLDDVWAGTVPARHVNRLIENLVLNPQSRVYAIRQGSMEWLGWDATTSAVVRLHNLVAVLISAFGKDIDLSELWMDAPDGAPEAEQFATIAEFNEAAFIKFMSRE